MVSNKAFTIGVLGVQGDYAMHIESLSAIGSAVPVPVRLAEQIESLDALILPGGESTTMTILFDRWGFREAISDFVARGKPVWGTCAGAIMLGSKVVDNDETVDVEPLGAIDVTVDRNAFGRQVDSFEACVTLELSPGILERFTGIFIRAPRFRDVGAGARVTGKLGGEPVMIEQGNVIISSFHPELTGDLRIHRYFASKLFETKEAAV